MLYRDLVRTLELLARDVDACVPLRGAEERW